MATGVSQSARPSDTAAQTVRTPAGTTLAYETYGSPDGRPLVFFHGMPGSRLLGEVLDDAAKNHGVLVVAPDRPGYGRSELPAEFDLTSVPAVVDALADAVAADDLAVAAFSAGAPYALTAAATMPDRVVSVDILSGSTPPAFVEDRPAIHRVFGFLAARLPRVLGASFRLQAALARHRSAGAIADLYTAAGSPVEVSEDDAAIVKADFLEAVAETTAGVRLDSRLAGSAWPVSVSEVRQPVRLWYGTADHLTKIGSARAFASALPNASLTEFESCGHLGTLLAGRAEMLERVLA